MALPKETSAKPTEEANPQSARMAKESIAEKRPPIKFLGWEKVLHPSQPVVAAGQIPHLCVCVCVCLIVFNHFKLTYLHIYISINIILVHFMY